MEYKNNYDDDNQFCILGQGSLEF